MKKGSISKYLENARSAAHNNYANADGQFPGGSFSQDGFASMTGAYKNAAGNAVAAGTSQPYVINITNASAGAVANFDILGSNEYLYNSGFDSSGNLVIGPVTISSGMPNVTYREMLAQFQNEPFRVGLTYLASATTNQIMEAINVVKKDASGNLSQRPITPTIDPYQQQSTVLSIPDVYDIDGNTKLRFSSILANATVKVQLYPAGNINLARGLEQQAVSKEFSDPGIIKAQPLKIT